MASGKQDQVQVASSFTSNGTSNPIVIDDGGDDEEQYDDAGDAPVFYDRNGACAASQAQSNSADEGVGEEDEIDDD